MNRIKWQTLSLLLLLTVIVSIGCSKAADTDTSEVDTTMNTQAEVMTSTEDVSETEIDTTEMDTDSESARVLIAKDKKVDSYYYEYIMNSDGQRLAGFKLWVQGNRIRFDMVDEGQSMFLDYDKGKGYIYIVEQNMLMVTPLETMGNEWESPFLFAEEIDSETFDGLVNKGTETIDGKKCIVFSGTMGSVKTTYYVWKDEGIILKMKVEMADQPTYEYYFKDLIINGNFEEELKLPEGAQIVGG